MRWFTRGAFAAPSSAPRPPPPFFEDILYENIYIAKAGPANSIFLTDSAEVRNITYRNFYVGVGQLGGLYHQLCRKKPLVQRAYPSDIHP